MISSRVIAFISSNVYPRYVNSFLRRVSTRPARFRNFLRAAFARPPIFFAMPSPPATLLLQPFRLGRHPSDLAAGRGVEAHRGRFAYIDRKSTRLNSSHLVISYAVFCLKKKKTTTRTSPRRSANPQSPP